MFLRVTRQRAKVKIIPSYETASSIGEVFRRWIANIIDRFHLGSFDYLTRVVYPHVVGSDKVKHNSPMAAKMTELARVLNPDGLEEYSRLRGFPPERR
ncbi:MAG: hypothetical protein FVQ81_13495 [Candidatus Glassbacteria bacterium]|nr:hypothetical protein [Candidatus Glassbacteria bacterium]